MEIRERGALRCENLVMAAASQRCTFQLTGANRIEWGESPGMVTRGGSAWSEVVNRKTTKINREDGKQLEIALHRDLWLYHRYYTP